MSLVKSRWDLFRWVLFRLPGPSIFPKATYGLVLRPFQIVVFKRINEDLFVRRVNVSCSQSGPGGSRGSHGAGGEEIAWGGKGADSVVWCWESGGPLGRFCLIFLFGRMWPESVGFLLDKWALSRHGVAKKYLVSLVVTLWLKPF